MTRRATDRLVVAAVTTVVGALFAVLGGLPEAALLAAPWAALLMLGFSRGSADEPVITVDIGTDRLIVGDEIDVTTTVSGAVGSVHVTPVPSSGFWPSADDADPPSAAGTHDAFILNRATIACSLPSSNWGSHDLGHVHVALSEPYRLFQRQGAAGGPTLVRVHPTPTQLQNLLAPWLVRRVSGAHMSRAVGRGVEFADIRPFASGDSLRDINWRASARSPELWVSQRHPDQATDAILLLDSFVESGHDAHAVVGLAIEAAVALAENHLGVTDRVGLIDMGGIVRWVTPGTGRLQLQRLTDAMLSTGLWANASQRKVLSVPAHVLPPRSFVVALTPLLDDRFIDALFVLGRGGHDIAVIECALGAEPRGEATQRHSLNISPRNEAKCSSAEAAGAPYPRGLLVNQAEEEPTAIRIESSGLASRMWNAERQMVRDRLAERGIAVATWHRGGHLDATLGELTLRRQRLVRTSMR